MNGLSEVFALRLEVSLARSRVYTTKRGQAVRLPKAVAFPDDVRELDVLQVGNGRLIVPRGRRWDDLFLSRPRATDDFMTARDQPAAEVRKSL
jgi:antitoxin VapB